MPVRTPAPRAPMPGSNGPWVDQLGKLGGEVRPHRAPQKLKGIFGYVNESRFNKASFAGKTAKTADLERLRKAQEMVAAGVDDHRIVKTTGWFRGADGQPRFEIDDRQATLTPLARYALHVTGEARGPASTILHHPELYQAYPELGKIKTRIRYDSNPESSASFSPADNLLQIRTNPKNKGSPPDSMMLHEFTHDTQLKEGFARGGSPKNIAAELEAEKTAAVKRRQVLQQFLSSGRMDAAAISTARREVQSLDARLGELANTDEAASQIYRRLMGQVEAFNVEARKDFSPERRRSQPPWETEGFERHEQIYR